MDCKGCLHTQGWRPAAHAVPVWTQNSLRVVYKLVVQSHKDAPPGLLPGCRQPPSTHPGWAARGASPPAQPGAGTLPRSATAGRVRGHHVGGCQPGLKLPGRTIALGVLCLCMQAVAILHSRYTQHASRKPGHSVSPFVPSLVDSHTPSTRPVTARTHNPAPHHPVHAATRLHPTPSRPAPNPTWNCPCLSSASSCCACCCVWPSAGCCARCARSRSRRAKWPPVVAGSSPSGSQVAQGVCLVRRPRRGRPAASGQQGLLEGNGGMHVPGWRCSMFGRGRRGCRTKAQHCSPCVPSPTAVQGFAPARRTRALAGSSWVAMDMGPASPLCAAARECQPRQVLVVPICKCCRGLFSDTPIPLSRQIAEGA